jgi:hypothetical protein
LDYDATDEREQFRSVEDRGLVEQSLGDALATTAAHIRLSPFEDSVAQTLAETARLVVM